MQGELLVGLVGPREVVRVRGPMAESTRPRRWRRPALPALAPGEALRPAAERLGASSAPGLPVVAMAGWPGS